MRKIMYIVINQDLDMSQGKVGAHTAHAVFDYIYKELLEQETSDGLYDELSCFKRFGDTIVTLKAHEKDLLKWEKQGYVTVRDMGYTEIPKNSITAVNLGIYDKDEGIPKWVQRLRLL